MCLVKESKPGCNRSLAACNLFPRMTTVTNLHFITRPQNIGKLRFVNTFIAG